MRILACLLLLSTSALAEEVGEVRLWFFSGVEFFEPQGTDVEVKLLQFGRDVSPSFDFERQSFKAPYGEYTLIVKAAGFKYFNRELLVAEQESEVLVGLRVSQIADFSEPPPQTRIEGRVVGPKGASEGFWVRIVPLSGGSQLLFEARLDHSGSFSVPVDQSLDFLILALEAAPEVGLRVVATKQIMAPWFETTHVEIPVE